MAALATAVLVPLAGAGTYVAGLTFVVKDSTGFGTIVDDGGVVCRASTGSGIGGGCIPWSTLGPGENSSLVMDEVMNTRVAYQVCIDNDGDSECGGFAGIPGCQDDIFFSHADGGIFFNPLGPLPTSFAPGCPGGYPGWVVLLCTGTHNDAINGPHQHPASAGSISATTIGSGFGDFCGGAGGGAAGDPVGKRYLIVP